MVSWSCGISAKEGDSVGMEYRSFLVIVFGFCGLVEVQGMRWVVLWAVVLSVTPEAVLPCL